jgi:uncharacterized protein (DUF58 family)
VHTTRCSSGLAVLALALVLASWLFDDLLLLSLAAGLLVFLLFRFVLFFRGLRVAGDTLAVHRETDKTIVRQGRTVAVTTVVHTQIPGRMTAHVTDLVPMGASVTTGETHAGIHDEITLSYEIAVLETGAIRFGGLDLSLEDAFFRTTIPCRAARFRDPVMHVEPFSFFALSESARLEGETEHERPYLLPGYGIRSFRAYLAGDDPRHIDWKLSAKHDRLFVREYTGIAGSPPLIVLDVPDRSALPGTADALKGAVSGLVEQAAGRHGAGNLLVISGANVIRYLPFGRQTAPVRALLTSITPGERLVHLYRSIDAATARSLARRIDEVPAADPRDRGFLSGLSTIYQTFPASMKPTTFETQVARVFHTLPTTDVYLFSGFSGDQSHIGKLILPARKRGMLVHARTTAASATPDVRRLITRYGATDFEVI